MLATELGGRIRRLRLARNLTLKQVEAKAKVSATHLSEIERGKTSPTVGALVRIARALGEDAARLVHDPGGERISVVRAHERRAFAEPGVTVERLSHPIEPAEVSLLELELRGRARVPAPWGGGEAFVLVLRGAVELVRDPGRVALSRGDAYHFAAGGRCEIANLGDEASRVLWVCAPPATL